MSAIPKENNYNVPSNTQSSKISLSEKIGYGFGDMASNVVVTAVSMFLMFYYTEVVGVSAAVVGTIILFSRIFDGITDLGMGIIVDKTKSKHGKARPWLLWMAVPIGIVTILLFSVPEGWSSTATIVYVAITYNLLFLIYTAINVPYGTLNALITQDQHQRSILNLFRMSMAVVTTIIISYLTMPLVTMFGGGQKAWQLTFTIFSIVGVGLFFATFFMTKERVTQVIDTKKSDVSIKEGIKALFKNKYWVLTLFIMIVTFVNQAVSTGVTVYYAQYILNDATLVGSLTMFLFIPLLLTMMVLAPIFKTFGRRNTVILGLVLMILGSLLMIIDPQSVLIVIVGTVIKGIGMAPLTGSVFAMLADTIEYGEWRTGVRAEGLVYSGGSLGTKVGGGLGAAAIGWILSLGGFISGTTGNQPDSALTVIEFLFIYLPIIISGILVVLLYFYKLDKIYPEIVKELKIRKA
jgi:GPH family glycoside/pentoside/hexuronide:cation symporter